MERIPLATYQKIEEYRLAGGTVIFTKRLPSLAPGMRDEGDTPKIRELSGKRALTEEDSLGDALHAALPADFTVPAEIGVVHRKLPYADIYFLANTSNRAVKANGKFRASANEATWWDPCTGKISKAGMNLELAPYESRVLVFSRATGPVRGQPMTSIPAIDISTDWTITFPGGRPEKMATLRPWTDDEVVSSIRARRRMSGRSR